MSESGPSSRRTRIAALAVAAVVLSFGFAVGSVSSAYADSTASISGTVYEGSASSHVPAANASVNLELPGGTYISSATTDANGNYSFTGLAPATYVIDFQPNYGDNFSSQWWSNRPTMSTATPISVAPGQVLTGIDATLAPGATVTGQVETTGGPGANALVTILNSAGDNIAGGNTDASGNYSISALPAGSFTAEFSNPLNSFLPAQWWNDSASLAGATFFTTSPGSTTTGINAFFTTAAGTASISGTVFAPGTPTTGLQSESVAALNAAGSSAGSTTTAADGSYTISGLPAGSYTLAFNGFSGAPQWWQNEPSFAAADFFAVSDGQVLTGFDAQIADGGSITGTVLDGGAGGAPLSGAYVSVYQDGVLVGNPGGSTDSNGDYTITGLAPGNYELNFQAPYGSNDVSQWWNGATSEANSTEVAVVDGATVAGINATLSAGGTISGTVSGRAANGTVFAAALAQLSVYSSDGTLFTNSDYADLNGKYTVSNLPAGRYTIYFVPQPGTTDFVPQWWKNKSTEATATVITVKAGQTKSNIDPVLASSALRFSTPKISGATKVGSTLTVEPGKWGPGTVTLGYQWSRNGAPVAGATSTTYLLTNADADATISATVTGTEAGYTTNSASSASTKAVTSGTLSAGSPTIQGTPTHGHVLTANPGTWGPGAVVLSYKWYRGSARIAGATSSSYTLGDTDIGKTISVRVTGAESGFATTTIASASTAPVT